MVAILGTDIVATLLEQLRVSDRYRVEESAFITVLFGA